MSARGGQGLTYSRAFLTTGDIPATLRDVGTAYKLLTGSQPPGLSSGYSA